MLIGALSQFSINNLYIHFQWQCTTQNAGRDLNKFNHFEGMVHCCLRLFLFRGNTICQEIFFIYLKFGCFHCYHVWLYKEIIHLPCLKLIWKQQTFSFLFFSVYLSSFQLLWQYKERPPIVSLKFAASRDCNFGGTSSWSLLKDCLCNCL